MAERLPKETAARLRDISTMPDTVFSEVILRLEAIPAKPFQADEITAAFNTVSTDASKLSSALVSLYWVFIQSKKNLDEFISDVLASPDLPADTRRDTLLGRLEKLLGVKSLFLGQNALSLIYDHERVVSGARVISDLRPVFGPELQEGPAGAIVVHTLKIEYQTANGPAEFFLALSLDDLNTLLLALSRAKEKDEQLRTFFKTEFFS